MDFSFAQKAQVLSEALPYIQKYNNKTVVVKYGGNAMINQDMKNAVISDCLLLKQVGVNVVLVHGGGPEINDMLKKIGKDSYFINGLRHTDEETMNIVQMSLAGKVNKDLTAQFIQNGGKAIGICGMDGGLLEAVRLEDGENDYGYVGDIEKVNIKVINDIINAGYIPVVATVAVGKDGHSYNVNADTAAAKIAGALNAEKIILLTDTRGVLRDKDDENTLIQKIKTQEIHEYIEQGIIQGGMIPKLNCCLTAMSEGVKSALITDGRVAHCILIELFTEAGLGTMIYDEE